MWQPQSITLGALVLGRLVSPAALPLSRSQAASLGELEACSSL